MGNCLRVGTLRIFAPGLRGPLKMPRGAALNNERATSMPTELKFTRPRAASSALPGRIAPLT
eukprot:4949289-Alexandrium_andersonii.AAC.1